MRPGLMYKYNGREVLYVMLDIGDKTLYMVIPSPDYSVVVNQSEHWDDIIGDVVLPFGEGHE